MRPPQVILCLSSLVACLLASTRLPAEDVPLRLPEGFTVGQFADDALAHNIYSMTIDPRGRVVVSGPDYVKTLHDDDGDGRADRAALFSSLPASGAHGLCFVGNDLVFTGDNVLGVLRDEHGDGRADGPPQRWASLKNPEHGANGIVHGPDGWLYVVCGNDAGVGAQNVTTPGSPVKTARCGAVLRISPDGKQMEIVAHGFRNPYDLDFSARGELFTVDSDGERDHHLPWYAPTRLFDVAQGMEHGWLLAGWQRSWNRPESFFDNVDRAAELGRGSPTGAIVYRHRQFPARYQGAVFSACWSMGRVYALPLSDQGATVKAKPEVFAQTAGDAGFAPVDLAVGPEGDLFVAIGGRGTRGGVFRISYRPEGSAPPAPTPPADPLQRVLRADQPLSSWSRAQWLPSARDLGRERFEAALLDSKQYAPQRVRAVEILVEVFGRLRTTVASQVVDDPETPAGVWGRVAWALSQNPSPEALPVVARLTFSSHARVQRAAFESLAVVAAYHELPDSLEVNWQAATASPDRRVRAAAIHCAISAERTERLPEVARLWVHPETRRDEAFFDAALELFRNPTHSVQSRLEAVRLVQLGLGDLRVQPGQPEVYSGYSGNAVEEVRPEVRAKVAAALAKAFPTQNEELNRKMARMFAMLSADEQGLVEFVTGQLTEKSDPDDDIHYLIVLSRLPGKRPPAVTEKIARSLCELHGKMKSQQRYPSRNWPLRVGEAFTELCLRDEALAGMLANHKELRLPEHAIFALLMPARERQAAARRLLTSREIASLREPDVWTSELVAVVSCLPDDQIIPFLLQKKWDNVALRDAIALVLARNPRPEYHKQLVESTSSTQPDVVLASAQALRKLPRSTEKEDPRNVAAALRALKQAALVKGQEEQRTALVDLLRYWSAQDIHVANHDDSLAVWNAWHEWFQKTYPNEAAALAGLSGGDAAQWKERIVEIPWENGDAARGKALFEKKACHRCHVGNNRLGPDLAGITGRLSREDLLATIVDPNKEISPTYRTVAVRTRSGRVYTGLLVYESPDATLLQTTPDVTVRISGEEFEAQEPGTVSLMPTGLLNDATDADVADLFAYLKTLTAGGK
ncbi:MAG: c-type cytochrome [Planctomycetia bacterium]|nr:c-type cytochrome [Planctomycetia bacterium]